MNDDSNERSDKLNREAWLTSLKELLSPRLTAHDLPLPNASVTCGWPSHGGTALPWRVVGECWNAKRSLLGRPEIFISPTLDDPLQVAHVLLHELIHAALPEAGHGVAFKRVAMALGLEGPMTATTPSAWLAEDLQQLLAQLGPYPHGRIDPGRLSGVAAPVKPRMCPVEKKQGTRLLKVVCPACGYVVRTTAKWLARGVPTCPCGVLMRFSGAGVIFAAADEVRNRQ